MGTVRRLGPEGSRGRPPTGRIPPAAPPKKFPLPFILGGAGVLLLLLILVVALTSGGGGKKEPGRGQPKPRISEPPRAADPEVVKLEAEGRGKCEEGANLVKPRLKPDPDALKENLRRDLERGLKLLNEGLIAYERAKMRSGKSYPTEEAARVRDAGVRAFCTDVEKEGQSSCDAGLRVIKACEEQMSSRTLTDEEKRVLRVELEKGIRYITEGMNLLDRSNQVSGNMFDTSKYGQARKAASYKLGELK
jgi:hypothetical protein